MKKMYWMGLFATLLAWGGCSEENGLNSENNGNEPMDEQAYLTVRIMDAGANTRASDGGFEEVEINVVTFQNKAFALQLFCTTISRVLVVFLPKLKNAINKY